MGNQPFHTSYELHLPLLEVFKPIASRIKLKKEALEIDLAFL